MVPTYRTLIAAAAAILLGASGVDAQDSDRVALKKIDRSLQASLDSGGKRRVILTVKPGYRAEIRKALRTHGDVVVSESPLIDALVAEVHGDDVMELAKHPWVAFVSDDAEVEAGAKADRVGGGRLARTGKSASKVTNVPAISVRETLGLPRQPNFEVPYDGRGIGVALVDSGISPNADLRSRIRGFYDFTRGGVPAEPFDDFGHGTHIAGLIGSNGTLSGGTLLGVAPEVHFVGFKVLDRKGQGRTSDVINAIEYITANRAALNVQIINISLGHPVYAPVSADPLVAAVEAASRAGLIVVASAGNYGYNGDTGETGYTGITSPGNAPSALTAGAVNTQHSLARGDDVIPRYSSRGPTWFDAVVKPDLVAPGHRLISDATLVSELYKGLTNNRLSTRRGTFLELSGTSMAAGVTTGTVALMLDAHRRRHPFSPALSPNAVKAVLEYSAIPLSGADVFTQGAGSLNAGGALELAQDIETLMPRRMKWAPFGSTCTIFAAAEGCLTWSQRVIWGDTIYTGTMVYFNLPQWSLAAAWNDDNIVWGTATAQVFDDNIVWGTAATWAADLVWDDRLIGLMDDDNIVWGTDFDDNIVWGTLNDDNIVWGTYDGDNIVWGTSDGDNIVWGTTRDGDNIVWGTWDDIVWGTNDDNIVWGTNDNIIWGTSVLPGYKK